MVISIDNVRYHYLDEGEGDPVLMLHGNPTWSFYYRRLAAALGETHRVVVPDHVGCGRSQKPRRYPYCLARHIENTERLVEHLDLRNLTLVMHDWGGPIGMGLAVRHPERIARLVLSNTAAFRWHRLPWPLALARIPGVGDLLVRGLNLFVGLAPFLAVHHHERMTREVRAAYGAPYRSWGDRVAVLRFIQDIPTHPGHPSYPTLAEIERRLHLLAHRPVLLVWGERDWVFTTEVLQRWQEFFPRARIRRVPDAGHWLLEDAHERVIPWIREFVTS